jgi:hypothetical protein
MDNTTSDTRSCTALGAAPSVVQRSTKVPCTKSIELGRCAIAATPWNKLSFSPFPYQPAATSANCMLSDRSGS